MSDTRAETAPMAAFHENRGCEPAAPEEAPMGPSPASKAALVATNQIQDPQVLTPVSPESRVRTGIQMSQGQDQERIRSEYQSRRKRSVAVQKTDLGCLFYLLFFPVLVVAPRWFDTAEALLAAAALFCCLLISLCCERCPACGRWLPWSFAQRKSCPRCHTPFQD
jgi:hypothetical protein